MVTLVPFRPTLSMVTDGITARNGLKKAKNRTAAIPATDPNRIVLRKKRTRHVWRPAAVNAACLDTGVASGSGGPRLAKSVMREDG